MPLLSDKTPLSQNFQYNFWSILGVGGVIHSFIFLMEYIIILIGIKLIWKEDYIISLLLAKC